MSALSDLVHGNFGNIGHDLSADPWGTAAGVLGGAALVAAPFTFGATLPFAATELGAAGGVGGAEAAGGLGGFLGFGGADAAGAGGLGGALGFGSEAAAGGTTAFDSLLTGTGAGGFSAAEAGTGVTEAGGSLLGGFGGGTGGASGGLGPAVDAAYGAGTGSTGFGSTAAEGITAATGGAPAAGAGASGGTDWLSAAGSALARNPLQTAGAVAAAGGLAYNMYAGQQTPPNVDAIRQQAQQLGTSGQTLQNYLTTGTLPPALQASMDTATSAARARIISGYASRGLPTDPSQDSALAQDLNNLQIQAVAAMAQTQTQLFNTGMQEVGMSAGLLQWLQTRDDKQSQQMGQAISNFAGALAGMGSRNNVTINVPRQAAA